MIIANKCVRLFKIKRHCFLFLLSLSAPGFTETVAINNFWQCTTEDATNKQWIAKSMYQKIAINFAFAACKKQSKEPHTCKAAKSNCEQFINGVSVKPMWQCTAFDSLAMAWNSNLYWQGEDAALGAKAYCKEKSAVPDTCYINMLTCKNMNGDQT